MERLFEVRKTHFNDQRDGLIIDFGDTQNHCGPEIAPLPYERNTPLLEYLYCLRGVRREASSLLQAEYDERERGLQLMQCVEEEQSVWQGAIVQAWETHRANPPSLEPTSAPVVKKSELMKRQEVLARDSRLT